MTNPAAERQAHWQNVYRTRTADSVSWYRPHLEISLELLERAGVSVDSRLIDVGGGASTLVDDLLARGLGRITVLDLSAAALDVARTRLGERARDVAWRVDDVLTAALPAGGFDVWHDRAVFHFLTDPADAARYARQAALAVRPGGHAVIAGFAPDGPERCSGLPVARRSAQEIEQLLGPAFRLLERRGERHLTPAGGEQSFEYALLTRI